MRAQPTATPVSFHETAQTRPWTSGSPRAPSSLGISENGPIWKHATSIAVAIVEQEPSVREALQLLIDQAKELRFTAAFANAESALKGVPRHRPEVLLVDLNLPGCSAMECVRSLKRQFVDMKVLMLTNGEGVEHIFEALRAGASGFISKRNLATDALPAIVEVAEGGAPMFGGVIAQVVAFFQKQGETSSTANQLSPRETQILDYLTEGFLYKQIAEELGITYDTVNGYIKSLYEKLHVHSRAEAVAKRLGRWPNSASRQIVRPA